MKRLIALALLALFSVGMASAQERKISEYHLDGNLALKGLDPVSFFAEGGSLPTAGNKEVELVFEGVKYLFAAEQNKEMFLDAPLKYEPSYGGWCGWGMRNGMKVPVTDPSISIVNGNRLHVFSSNRAKRNFENGLAANEAAADASWFKLSGENPRN